MSIQRDNEKVWIDGVQGFDPCEFVSSVHGCQARIMQSVGESLGYDDLICYGAFAFRVSVHDELCPSAGHPCCGYQCVANSNRATGWQSRFFESFPWSPPKPDRAAFEAEVCDAIRASVDRGIPVQYCAEEDGLIVGYGDRGRRWWCVHPYHKGGREMFWHDQGSGFAGGKWPWGVAVCVEPLPADQRPTPRELMSSALKQAVDMWSAGKRERYFVGDAAYSHWLGWLRDVEAGSCADPKKGMHGNGWCFDVLTNTRRIAARWLKQRADDLGPAAAPALRDAASHFAQIRELCLAGYRNSWDLAPAPQKFDAWTSTMRRQQIERLEAAREHDRIAIAAIGNALQAAEA